ncbi:MBOAT family O-acyltransferase [Bradyrhizobium iriomotense]|uniref:Probable alginate O-acetylase AlgI n=1 Tax=Bradyrhizobium iriomotense TaxID=441950 RepID=A0ABQ6B3U4_9BRAD|nr:MBOAT family O-acyltransferase [Bradyrhizobium iriomotense]GLR87565.1 alginate O-acetyltransferase [Bradyrhizobium iriomotense]
MLFSDPVFFLFFALYFSAHLLTPPQYRLYLLIFGSTVFYAWWKNEYAWLPYALSTIAWGGVLWIEQAEAPRVRKWRLFLVLAVLFTPLVVFKYAHFLIYDVAGGFTAAWPHVFRGELRFSLPLGISFVTFTLTAYVVNVYRRQFPIESRLTAILGYVLFFPHLIAGPILRPHELLPQLSKASRALDARFTLGASLFVVGLAKKLIFADGISPYVDLAYAPGAHGAYDYLLAIYGFSMQIYCDFSGYTDMAVGLAYLLRIRLPRNFRSAYTSKSIIEFWRRWHITLSHWLRDYLYIALGGNRQGAARQLANLMITMLIGGLWHGANWTFAIWGGLHGIGISLNHLFNRVWPNAKLPAWLGIITTFHFVTIAWIYFRAPTLTSAHEVLAGPFISSSTGLRAFLSEHAYPLVLLLAFLAVHRFDDHARVRLAVRRAQKTVVWATLLTISVLAIAVSQGSSAKFIYFDF